MQELLSEFWRDLLDERLSEVSVDEEVMSTEEELLHQTVLLDVSHERCLPLLDNIILVCLVSSDLVKLLELKADSALAFPT